MFFPASEIVEHISGCGSVAASDNGWEKVFLPSLEALFSMPEAEPFKFPVNDAHYNKRIKNPMCLSVIESKLKTGQYDDPWLYINDIWKMFENASIYNGKNSEINNFATIVRVITNIKPRVVKMDFQFIFTLLILAFEIILRAH